ncbi:MAG TPA: diguanylate cyclase, partial [Fimbriimonas sp.]|nr:diguanylate cyclase [Fimbriimonas sp.]
FEGLEGMRKFYGEQSILDFLSDAADFFRDNLRRLDIVARFGDTGFAIILPSGGKNVSMVRDRLFESLVGWVNGRYGNTGAVKVQIGSAVSPHDGRNGRLMLEAAESNPFVPQKLVA